MTNGIVKCPRCGLSLIEEESEIHFCQKRETDYRFTADGCLLYFDGFRWHRHKLSADILQGEEWKRISHELYRTAGIGLNN